MAVYELNNGQLLRVARSIDGKLQQRYFSLIGLNKTKQAAMRRDARALDKGVRGINLVRRPSPAFRVQVQTKGKSHVREFSVKRLGAEKAWAQATKYLCECRGYKSVPKAWKERQPKVKA